MGFINNNKELEQFRFPMEKLFRKAKYTLSKEEEKNCMVAVRRDSVYDTNWSSWRHRDGVS